MSLKRLQAMAAELALGAVGAILLRSVSERAAATVPGLTYSSTKPKSPTTR